MVAETIETVREVPLQEPIPVRRGRGRPPKLNADGTRANPPRSAGGRKRRSGTRRSAPRGPKSLQGEIANFLTLANTLVLMSPLGTRPAEASIDPSIPAERVGDELDAAEINALAAALDAQARRSPTFRKYLEKVLGAASGGQLLSVFGIIAARRVARHGLIPNGEAVDFGLGMMIASGGLDARVPTPAANDDPDPLSGERPPVSIDPESIESLGMEP